MHNMSRRSKAIVVALFLGGFGAHKFYLNRPGQGILFAVFFWTFIPALIALVDIIRFLAMGEERFNRIYH